MDLVKWIFLLGLTCTWIISNEAVIAATTTATPPQTTKPAQPVPVQPAPQIASVTPSQLPTSTQIQTLAINGSGFDSDTKVELMYSVGAGAGQWRAPLHGFQVLSSSQIRVNVVTGADADQLRIRVTNSRGTSNQASLMIVKAAPVPIAQPLPIIAPPTPIPVPALTSPPATNTAGTTPQIAKPPPAPVVAAPAPVVQPAPQIANVTPSQIATATQIQTITINGSGFDSSTQVEWMYGVGPGAGAWRTPINSPQVLSASQIRVSVQSGNDPDQMRIRVVNSRGSSNQVNVMIVKAAPVPIAQPSPIIAPPTPIPVPALTSPPATNTAGTTPQIAKPPPAPVVAAPAPVVLAAPQITGVSPAQIITSTQIQTININGSGFDSGTRVEWMYGVGPGAGAWRTPINTPQILSNSQIRVSVQSGNDPDQLRIRVVNSRGSSNQVNVTIVKAAPAPIAPPALVIAPPLLTSPSPGTMAGTTPQTSTPAQLPHTVTYCGSKWYQQLGLQFAEALQATMGGYSFDTACQRHDTCYGDCRTARGDCDIRMRTDAEAACASARNKQNCIADAWIFYQKVSERGDTAFKQARASCPISPVASNAAGTSPQASKPAVQPAPVAASQPAPAIAPPSPVAPPAAPQIANITPSQLSTSAQIQTITINGSGFDSGTRVEWMYGVGAGAGEWRTPLNIPQVLSSSQIRVGMQTGNDPDQMRIRVVNSRGSSNQVNVTIVKAAPSPVAQPLPVTPPAPSAAPARLSTSVGTYPVAGPITQGYGVAWSENKLKTHTGIDIGAPKGTAVVSVTAGKVFKIGSLGGEWGQYVIVKESSGAAKGYLHVTPSVTEGKDVGKGDKIGAVYKDHLHFNVCTKTDFCQRGALPTSKPDTN